MEFVYEKYILYKSVSLPEKEGFIENSSELIYTGVDNLQSKNKFISLLILLMAKSMIKTNVSIIVPS